MSWPRNAAIYWPRHGAVNLDEARAEEIGHGLDRERLTPLMDMALGFLYLSQPKPPERSKGGGEELIGNGDFPAVAQRR
ncbi:hypothetical protein E2562_009106 [Oryza meyeriana var. granulata]|uniref:Uncharacterized protein n=1 Tax=Oryza meyeriana var. granulata TaxID=110450 RepID=A0A6G1D088_9ORYZ|nr:hypothetical protein E2562_009106 [Oryza meyeriana var. granulata]